MFLVASFLLISTAVVFVYKYVEKTLPRMITIADYQPLLVTSVYDRNGTKIGEFFRERRTLVPYDKIPKNMVNAFLAAEDDQFFKHGGINYLAIMRATFANLRAGKNVQGGSTITQQVAKTLLLSNEKTYIRKLKEALLAQKMEESLSKEDILYLYLNQIYFGQGAYGVALAAETYFRKPIEKLSLAETAILAGLPKAPSAYSPVHNSVRSKERQVYVLNRMSELGFISKSDAEKAIKEPIHVQLRENYKDYSPYFLETVREALLPKVGESALLDEGLKIYTSLDLAQQIKAQQSAMAGLRDLDKRQGFRGALGNVTSPKEVGEFLLKMRNKLILEERPERVILPDGKFQEYGDLNVNYDVRKNGLPFYLKIGKPVEGIVSKVDDQLGLVYVRVAEIEGVIDFETMSWARKPNAEKRYDLDRINSPSQALKMGDLVEVKVTSEKFSSLRLQRILAKNKQSAPDVSKFVMLELEQEPVAEVALISFDQASQDVIAMIGGTNFEKSEYNRALQAARQTGSSFKSIVYASALDKGYTPSSMIMDAPIVYEESTEGQDDEDSKTWKPANHSKTFSGDITFRNALVKSLNVPAVKVVEDVGVPWAMDYAHRLGIFSSLNPDFTLTLGSSSVTLYEMTKVFSEFGRMGKRIRPIIVHKVQDRRGKTLVENISLDERYTKETTEIEKQFTDRRSHYLEWIKDPNLPANAAELAKLKNKADSNFFFEDPDQLIKPTTAYLITSLLKGVIEDPSGTGARARALNREVAGKTGTTNGYFDAWFLGFTSQVATGVWVGFDQQKSLGRGEVGGMSALPIWLEFMKAVHENLPSVTFPIPKGIVFANIDAENGQLPGPGSKRVIRQAFLEGTEPTSSTKNKAESDTDFYKKDLSE